MMIDPLQWEDVWFWLIALLGVALWTLFRTLRYMYGNGGLDGTGSGKSDIGGNRHHGRGSATGGPLFGPGDGSGFGGDGGGSGDGGA